MRKAFGLMAVLLLLGGATMGWCVKTVYASHDQVQFTENVLAGDPVAADGLSIQTHATYGGQMFWDSTTLLQGDEPPITQTAYHFFNTEQEEESEESYRGIELYSDLGSSGSNFLDVPKYKRTGLDRAYQELYDSAEPGQEAQKTIHVADYCKYYPLAGFISLISWRNFSVSQYFQTRNSQFPWKKTALGWCTHQVRIRTKVSSSIFIRKELLHQKPFIFLSIIVQTKTISWIPA